MKISFVGPDTRLKPYVKSIWILESQVGMPPSDHNIAAPNGLPKLIFNCENSIISVVDGKIQKSKERSLYFVGTRDTSTSIYTTAGPTCCVGIEFYPHGAYPIFGIHMTEAVNHLLPVDDLSTSWKERACSSLQDLKSVRHVVDFIQNQLIDSLEKKQLSSSAIQRNSLVGYCVDSLKAANGLVTISDLEHSTGYSRRYLEMLFKEYVGFPPKVLAGIFRFQKFYRKWARGKSYDEIKDELYNYYYDQAHFAKEFKRMTGFSPQQFSQRGSNEFGRRLTLH